MRILLWIARGISDYCILSMRIILWIARWISDYGILSMRNILWLTRGICDCCIQLVMTCTNLGGVALELVLAAVGAMLTLATFLPPFEDMSAMSAHPSASTWTGRDHYH